ncbi:hypothetical protein [Butyrivibrio fibrisolvens]|uniref:hypothetical protein n=1 Tax=Butyrivibrio fibrisolvens TaxID=831 RepID=UPI0003B42F9F|nr:hypothetical protein [Butyrivibrio fibrisolvens]
MTLIAAIILFLAIACIIGMIIYFMHKNKQIKEYENRVQTMYNDACLRIAEMERACSERIKQSENISAARIRQEESISVEKIRQEESRIAARQKELDSKFAQMEEERILREDINRKNDREVITELHVQLSRIDKDLKHIMPKIDNIKSYTEEANALSNNIDQMNKDTQELFKDFKETSQAAIKDFYNSLSQRTSNIESQFGLSVDKFNSKMRELMDEFSDEIKICIEDKAGLNYDDIVKAVESVWDEKSLYSDYHSDLYEIKSSVENLSSSISGFDRDISNIDSAISSLGYNISNIESSISSIEYKIY